MYMEGSVLVLWFSFVENDNSTLHNWVSWRRLAMSASLYHGTYMYILVLQPTLPSDLWRRWHNIHVELLYHSEMLCRWRELVCLLSLSEYSDGVLNFWGLGTWPNTLATWIFIVALLKNAVFTNHQLRWELVVSHECLFTCAASAYVSFLVEMTPVHTAVHVYIRMGMDRYIKKKACSTFFVILPCLVWLDKEHSWQGEVWKLIVELGCMPMKNWRTGTTKMCVFVCVCVFVFMLVDHTSLATHWPF